MLQFIYNIYIYTAKARLSFCAHTDRCDAVNWLIFRIFRPIYTQCNHIQSSNSTLFTCWAHIQHIHTFSLQGTVGSRNWAFSKNSNRICKKRNPRNGQFALQGIRKNYQKGEKHSGVYRRIANPEKDSRGRNRNWNGSDIHAWTRQIQQSDKRLRQNNHNGSGTASY